MGDVKEEFGFALPPFSQVCKAVEKREPYIKISWYKNILIYIVDLTKIFGQSNYQNATI